MHATPEAPVGRLPADPPRAEAPGLAEAFPPAASADGPGFSLQARDPFGSLFPEQKCTAPCFPSKPGKPALRSPRMSRDPTT